MTDRPLLRKMIDAIHELQRQTATIAEQSLAATPAWPACVSNTPRSGTAITRRQCVYAQHYPLGVGSVLVFGEERRTVTRATHVVGDIGIAELDEPISAEPMRVLPWDWQRWIPTQRDQKMLKSPLPVVRANQRGQVVRDTVDVLSTKAYFSPHRGTPHPTPISMGDSGCPVWLPLEVPVLIGCLYTRGSCPSLAHYWEMVKTWAPEVQEAEWRP